MAKEFRVRLSDGEFEFLNQIKENDPKIKNNHDLFALLMLDHLNLESFRASRLKNIDLNVQTFVELTGELAFKGRGFQDDNGLPITNVQVGSEFLSIKSAREKAKKRLEEQQKALEN